MYRNSKKGFTVVELVIVIAIIAILAAVLIPTFAGLIQKANESKDTQLVKNLNTALAVDGNNHPTMQLALKAAAEFGYDVGKINASATGNEILWDSVNDLFCYYNKSESKIQYIPNFEPAAGKTPATYQLWKIYDGKNGNTVPAYESQTYSIYWAGEDAPSVTEVKVGFDAGTCTKALSLTYSNSGSAKDVVIRTNSFDTTVTATAFESGTFGSDDYKCDSIKHFGDAKEVNIIKAGQASYHEFGNVGFTQVASGKFVAEAGSKTNTVVANSADAVININGGEIERKYATDASFGGSNSKGNVELDVIAPDKVEEKKQDAIDAVTPISAFQISSYYELKQWAESDNEFGILTENITYQAHELNLDAFVEISTTKTLDLNGKTIQGFYVNNQNAAPDKQTIITVTSEGNLTVNDTVGGGLLYSKGAGCAIYNYGTLTINGGTFKYDHLYFGFYMTRWNAVMGTGTLVAEGYSHTCDTTNHVNIFSK